MTSPSDPRWKTAAYAYTEEDQRQKALDALETLQRCLEHHLRSLKSIRNYIDSEEYDLARKHNTFPRDVGRLERGAADQRLDEALAFLVHSTE